MAATRTQIYLTEEQRQKLDSLRERDGKTLAEVVREAIDAYIQKPGADPSRALAETFGSLPDLEVPSRDEWDRG
jgi:metal-responsive CopG/Arc/MetJ family transcriptional regulator